MFLVSLLIKMVLHYPRFSEICFFSSAVPVTVPITLLRGLSCRSGRWVRPGQAPDYLSGCGTTRGGWKQDTLLSQPRPFLSQSLILVLNMENEAACPQGHCDRYAAAHRGVGLGIGS